MTKSYDIDVERYNYMISPNAFCTDVFQTSFQINKERLIETGYPRNDFITNATQEDVIELKKKYHLPLDKKSFYMHLHGAIILMLLLDIHLN